MTYPIAAVDTKPYCGACGWKPFSLGHVYDLHADLICDACGADLLAYGWLIGHAPPEVFDVSGDTPLAGQASFAWVPDPFADTTDLQWRVDDGAWTLVSPATSIHVETGPFGSGDKISGQVRSVKNGTPGPWSVIVSDAIA
jgi:hypothetical protein